MCRELFDVPFAQELPGYKTHWRPVPTSKGARFPVALVLQELLEYGPHRVAYLRTEIESDREKSVTLEFFSDDGVKA